MRFVFRLLVSVMALALPALAHVGSKDVFEQVSAGPYKLFVTVRTPNVIPGVATIEVRASGPQVSGIRITPLPLAGEASKHPPSSDTMKVSPDDPQFFTGSLWLMAAGSWQVRFEVDGEAGHGSAGVPVPAIPISIMPMQRSLGIVLAVLGLILAIGMAGIVAAAVREARLTPGGVPSPGRRRRALVASAVTLAVAALVIYLGDRWWNVEAAGYAAGVYRPLEMKPVLNGNVLELLLSGYDERRGRLKAESSGDLVPDHGKLMHLYAIRWPEMDAVFHLHPQPAGENRLSMMLPAMPAGVYRLYADIVHSNGFPETLTANLTVPPGMSTAALAADDASAAPPAVSQRKIETTYKLPNGYSMVWDRPAVITANNAYSFQFRLLGPDGKPATDMQPYLGMSGHAAFVKYDGSVFAHTHPGGSASMHAMMLANGEMADMDMPMQVPMPEEPPSPVVQFPYGFPSAGQYRIFIQMKHGGVVDTGVFDADVS